MQSELLQAIRIILRGTETVCRYSAWKHGDSEVEITLHPSKGSEQHVGYVTTAHEAIQLVETTEARHATDDTDRDDHCDT